MKTYEFIKANYHAHTVRCKHATGDERTFTELAINSGLSVFGFSDHSPMVFPNDHHSGFRMELSELEDYCDTVLALKKEYEKDICIHLGLEVEYYPLCFDRLLEILADYPIEYLLMGQHCLKNEYEGISSGAPTEDASILRLYVNQVLEGLDTGRFLYVAHPDIINYQGDRETYRREMLKICEYAKEKEIPLEINLLGLYLKREYPNPLFWELAGEVGNDVCIGIDCHHNDLVVLPEQEQKALELANRYGLNLIPENKIEIKQKL